MNIFSTFLKWYGDICWVTKYAYKRKDNGSEKLWKVWMLVFDIADKASKDNYNSIHHKPNSRFWGDHLFVARFLNHLWFPYVSESNEQTLVNMYG